MGKYFVGWILGVPAVVHMKRTRAFIAAAATVAVAGPLGAVHAQTPVNGAARPEQPPSVVPTPPSTSLRDAMRATESQRRPVPATRDSASRTSADPPIGQTPTSSERAPRADRN